MKRKATAVWKGGPKAGEGIVTAGSGAFRNILFTAATSTNDFPCTTPSEMLAAAEASCVSLMVARELAIARIHPQKVETKSELDIVETKNGWNILGIKVVVKAVVGEVDEAELHKAVDRAKKNCAISNVLKCPVELEVELEPVGIHA